MSHHHCVEQTAKGFLAVAAFVAAAFLFQLFIAKVLAALVGLVLLYNLFFATKSEAPVSLEVLYVKALYAAQAMLAYVWWISAWEKFAQHTFPEALADGLAFFASQNPYAWYVQFLIGPATDKSVVLGYVVEWGEAAVALALVLGLVVAVWSKSASRRRNFLRLTCLALVGGMVMNAAFYLAIAWTGPAAAGVNAMMFWTQVILLYVNVSVLARSHNA